MGYNYSILDSTEFEHLSRDVVERLTGTRLRCYAPGKDGGIDASDAFCENTLHPHIIVQAKNWSLDNVRSKLPSALRKLAKQYKDSSIVPDELFIVIGCTLTRKIRISLEELGDQQKCGQWTFLDADDLDKFLENERNRDVLSRYLKLWITGTNDLQ